MKKKKKRKNEKKKNGREGNIKLGQGTANRERDKGDGGSRYFSRHV